MFLILIKCTVIQVFGSNSSKGNLFITATPHPSPTVPSLKVQHRTTENLPLSLVTHKAVFEQLKWIKSVTFKSQTCTDFGEVFRLPWYNNFEYQYEILVQDEQPTGTVTTTVHQFYS